MAGSEGQATGGARDCREKVHSLARKAAIVVAAETAYDVTDALATSPERYQEQLYRLARLAAKLAHDLEKLRSAKSLGEEDRKTVTWAMESLKYLQKDLEEVLDCLASLEERERRRLVLELASLAVAPDHRAYRVAELLSS